METVKKIKNKMLEEYIECAQLSKLYETKRWSLDEFRDRIESLSIEASKFFLLERTKIWSNTVSDEVSSRFNIVLKKSLLKIESEFWMNLRMSYVQIMKAQEEKFLDFLAGKPYYYYDWLFLYCSL
jgi:predicted nuclease with TOPRIM domain